MDTILKTDTISIICKELFTVKFLHSGYGISHYTSISESIVLEPDSASKKLFDNYSMGYRFFNDTLICFIRTSLLLLSPPSPEPQTPYIKLSGGEQIRFFINVTTDFLSKTNVEVTGAKQVYQFTNRVNAGTGGFICMHAAGVNNDDLKNVDSVKPDKTSFGVIDIYDTGAVNSSYEIFDAIGTQQLKSPAYSIRFTSKI